MAESNIKTRLPVTLSRPLLFIVWEQDEFAVMIIPIILSLFVRQLLFGLIIGVVLMFAYIKMKKAKPNNYLFHIAWKHGLVNLKNVPKPYIRIFLQ